MSRSLNLTAYKYGMQLAARDAGYPTLEHFTKRAFTLPGAAIGAGLGAGVGAMVDSEDRLRGAATGAGLGGLAGAGAGALAGHLERGAGKAVAKAAPKAEQTATKAVAKAEPAVAKAAPTPAQPKGKPTVIGEPSVPPNPVDTSRYQSEARAMAQSHFNPPDSASIRKMNKTHIGEASVPQAASPLAPTREVVAPPPTVVPATGRTQSGVRAEVPAGIPVRSGGTPVFSPDPRTGAPIFVGMRGT